MLTVKLIDTNELAKMFQEIYCVKTFCEEKLAISRTTFYSWDSPEGKEKVRLYTIEDLANTLNIHPFKLIEITEKENTLSGTDEEADADFNLIFPEEDDNVFEVKKSEESPTCTYEVELNYAAIVSCMEKLFEGDNQTGCTVEQVCSEKYLNISRSTFYSWKNYPKKISLKYISRISNAFKIHPHDIITVREIPLTKTR